MRMYTRIKHVPHLVSGKNCRRRGRNVPAVPNRPQPPLRAPSVARRHRRPRHPAGTPGKKQRPAPRPPGPAPPAVLW